MQAFGSSSAGYVVRLDRGEEVLTCLTAELAQHQGAMVTGLGAVHQVVLGYYDLARREYERHELAGELELVSFHANLTWLEGKPFVHAHAVVCGPDLLARAGHLFSAEIAVTGEFFVTVTDRRIERRRDEKVGLNLMAGEH